MSITVKELEHLAKLSKLTLNNEEKDRLIDEMDGIIAFAEKLNELDVDNIKPTMHAADIYNVFREDEIKPSYKAEEIVQNAPKSSANCFVVPKAVEQ